MPQVLGETKTGACLRVVFDNAPVSIPLDPATTFGDLARTVRGMSAQLHGRASAITVVFSDDRTAERTLPAWGYELPDTALNGTENGMREANFDI